MHGAQGDRNTSKLQIDQCIEQRKSSEIKHNAGSISQLYFKRQMANIVGGPCND